MTSSTKLSMSTVKGKQQRSLGSADNYPSNNAHPSTLAASTLLILFVENLKYRFIYFFKEQE
jgi:hypothetical protein